MQFSDLNNHRCCSQRRISKNILTAAYIAEFEQPGQSSPVKPVESGQSGQSGQSSQQSAKKPPFPMFKNMKPLKVVNKTLGEIAIAANEMELAAVNEKVAAHKKWIAEMVAAGRAAIKDLYAARSLLSLLLEL